MTFDEEVTPGRPLLVERFRVVMGDTDAARVIYFGAPPRWAERITTTWLASVGLSLSDMFRAGTGLPAVRLEVDYTAPLRLDDEVEARLWVKERSERSVTFRTEFRRVANRDLACQVLLTQVFVLVDVDGVRSAPLPAEIVAALDRGTA
jgi:acyl-CoA thioester hydrolase